MPAERGPSGTGHDEVYDCREGDCECDRQGLAPDADCPYDGFPADPPVAVPGPASLSPAEPPDEHPDATSRPWAVDPAYPCTFGGDLMGSEGEWGVRVGETAEPEDAALIVQAVNERAALLAAGERDRRRIARLTEALREIVSFPAFGSRQDAKSIARAVLAGEEDADNG